MTAEDSKPKAPQQEERDRSTLVHKLILEQGKRTNDESNLRRISKDSAIPRKILQYWHDPSNLPNDVYECLSSWKKLEDNGFDIFLHNDISAAKYIAKVYGEKQQRAFARCSHPAMRSDYLRLCFMVQEGGFYVDADDVLIADDCSHLLNNNLLKLQPLCYDISAGGMMPAADIWNPAISSDRRNFYVNNDPLIAPARHPLLIRALTRATEKLLCDDSFPEIQATTGPGNLTIALVDHANFLRANGQHLDFEFINGWESIAEMRWDLSYRKDERNWRNIYGC